MTRGLLRRPLICLGALLALLNCECEGTVTPPDAGDGGLVTEDSGEVFALPGPDLVVLEGSRVQLDAHASRALDGDAVLSWSQVEGPQVLLTNPTGPSPAFVAPLAPDVLRFRLRVTSKGESTFDEVTVRVASEPGPLPVLAEVPGDVRAIEGDVDSFSIEQRGDVAMDVTWSARALCEDGMAAVVDSTVEVQLPDLLPCAVRVDGVTADGRRVAPAVRVYWPDDTGRSLTTDLGASGFTLEPGENATVSFMSEAQGDELRLWEATGAAAALSSTIESQAATFEAPLEVRRIVFGGERRRGGFSGGVRYLVLDVTAGAGNRAPSVNPGPDRTTVPGGLFSLAVTADDLDDDTLEFRVEQVLGQAATPITDQLFQAPEEEGILLFHVAAFDGTVSSPTASVRVRVDPGSTNLPPTLDLDTVVFVAPGRTFVIDASSATDDSGFIERWTIAQEESDEIRLLSEPLEVATAEEARVSLVAQSDGDVYHFRVTVFDALGASTSQEVEVTVEDAGPWIDPVRGDDDDGTGTPAQPFASLGAALDTAERHRFAELNLAGDEHQPFAGQLPSGLSLRGGFAWSGSAYEEDAQRPVLPVAEGGLLVDGGELEHLEVRLTTPTAALVLDQTSALLDVLVSEGPLHEGSAVEVMSGAEVDIRDTEIVGGAVADESQALIDLLPSSRVRLEQSSVTAGPGGERMAVRCVQALLDVIGGNILGSTNADEAIGIDAEECDLQLVGAQAAGGVGDRLAVGLRARDSAVVVDEGSVVIGLTEGACDLAVAVQLESGDGSVQVGGRLVAAEPLGVATHAIGVHLAADRAELVASEVSAEAEELAEAVLLDADELLVEVGTLSSRSVDGEARGFTLQSGLAPSLRGTSGIIEGAAARGVLWTGDLPPDDLTLDEIFLSLVGADEAIGVGLGAAAGVSIEDTVIEVSAGAGTTPSRGLTFGAGTVSDSAIRVVGEANVLGLVVAVAEGGAVLERTSIAATSNGGDAVGIRVAAPTELFSTLVRASGTGSTTAVEAREAAILRHVTVLSAGTGVLLDSAAASVDLANSLLRAEPSILQIPGAGDLNAAAGCAFDSAVAFEDESGAQVTDANALAALPCPGCVFTDTTGLVDDNGHLDAAAVDLIDRGIGAYAHPLDIDGELRPYGAAPDIGCDEYVPPM